MQTYYNVTFRNDGESRASVSLHADTAADALLAGSISLTLALVSLLAFGVMGAAFIFGE